MKIVIKAKNIKLNRALENLIEEKINDLEKFLQIFQAREYFNHFFGKGKPRVEAWIEIGKESLHHQKGPVFRAEVQLRFPKRSVRSEAIEKNLRMAITTVKDELQRQLKQYKLKTFTKTSALTKRRARVLKKFLRLAPQARFWRKGRIREEGIWLKNQK